MRPVGVRSLTGGHFEPAIGWEALVTRPGLLQPGDIVHTQNPGRLSRAIRWLAKKKDGQRAWASHTAMLLSADPAEMLIEAQLRVGVRPAYVYAHRGARAAIHRIPGGLTAPQRRQICLYALAYEGAAYGAHKALALALDHLIGDRYLFRRLIWEHRYPICSWLVAWAYDVTMRVRFGAPPDSVSPDDIMDYCMAEGWELVWVDSAETKAQIEAIYQLRGRGRSGRT